MLRRKENKNKHLIIILGNVVIDEPHKRVFFVEILKTVTDCSRFKTELEEMKKGGK